MSRADAPLSGACLAHLRARLRSRPPRVLRETAPRRSRSQQRLHLLSEGPIARRTPPSRTRCAPRPDAPAPRDRGLRSGCVGQAPSAVRWVVCEGSRTSRFFANFQPLITVSWEIFGAPTSDTARSFYAPWTWQVFLTVRASLPNRRIRAAGRNAMGVRSIALSSVFWCVYRVGGPACDRRRACTRRRRRHQPCPCGCGSNSAASGRDTSVR